MKHAMSEKESLLTKVACESRESAEVSVWLSERQNDEHDKCRKRK